MKKQRSFKQRWNATALRRILKEYKENNETYLCHASQEFYDLWQNYRHEIRALACDFIPEEKQHTFNYVLFYHISSKQTRIDFLKHEIKRLSCKKHTHPGSNI